MGTMSEPLPRWLFPLPARLVASPGSVLCLALLANALCQPYLGLFHDSRLYAFYLESRLEPGRAFDHDLYLTYGSQDRYSLFSFLMLPVVKLVGLDAGMFAVYIFSKAMLLWGFQRLVRVLVRDDTLTAVIVLFLAVAPISFGGNEVFHVNEGFLTPRLLASALVLLGLERMLAGKLLWPIGLLFGAFLLHPLMGLGGVLTLVMWWAFGRLRWWQLGGLALIAVLASVGVLAYEPLGTRVFGHADEVWRKTILQICFFIKPTEWFLEDWARMAWDVTIVVAGACTFARHCARFLWAVLVVGLIGLAGSLVGVETDYLLLIQTSPYRTLWLLEFLAIPLGFMAVAALWQRGTVPARSGSLALLLYITDEREFSTRTMIFCVMLALVFGLLVVWYRGLERRPAKADWLWLASRAGFLTACGLLVVFSILTLCIGSQSGDVPLHPTGLLRVLAHVNARLICLLGVCQLAGWVGDALSYSRRFQVTVAATAVAYLAILAYLQVSPAYLTHFIPEERHVEFVADYLREHGDGSGAAPCVYWNTDIYLIWFRLRANSYVTIYQMAGCAFNRETASEGKRRVRLVARFEADTDRMAPKPIPPRWQKFFEDFRDCPPDAPAPSRDDLLTLAAEEQLDYAILPIDIDHLYCETDGHFYIYDCRHLRALSARAKEPGGVSAAVASGDR